MSGAVPRIPPVVDPPPEVAEILSKTLVSDGTPLRIFSTLAHHPSLLKRFNVLGGLFLAKGVLDPKLRELVILRTAWRTRCRYEFGQHVVIGRQVGLTAEDLRNVCREEGDPNWAPAVRVAIIFADELLAMDDVTDDTWAAVQSTLDEAALLELCCLVGFYRMTAGMLNTMRVQPEPGLPGWPQGVTPS